MDNLLSWAPLLLSVLAMAGSGVAWLGGRGKRRADETAVITDTILDLLEPVKAELKEEREQRRQLGQEFETYKAEKNAEIERLKRELNEERRLRIESTADLMARIRALEAEREALEAQRDALQAENEALKGGNDAI